MALKKKLKFPVSLFVFRKNFGPAKARNFGAKKASGHYLLFLDGDVELKSQSLSNVIKLVKSGQVQAFTGIWDYQQKSQKFFPRFKALRDWSYWSGERKKNSHYYLFSTRIAGIEKKLFLKLGGFIEDYKEPTVEDIEFTYRIEKQSSIKFCPDIVVRHEFEDFLPIAVKYFKRSRDWIGLYFKRFRFDPVATTKSEATKSVSSTVMILALLLSIIYPLFLIPTALLLILYIYLDFKFWKFVFKKKGIVFLLASIPTAIVLYLIINLGAAWGYLLVLKAKYRPH